MRNKTDFLFHIQMLTFLTGRWLLLFLRAVVFRRNERRIVRIFLISLLLIVFRVLTAKVLVVTVIALRLQELFRLLLLHITFRFLLYLGAFARTQLVTCRGHLCPFSCFVFSDSFLFFSVQTPP